MPSKFPYAFSAAAFERWGLEVGGTVHRGAVRSGRVYVGAEPIPRAWATATNGTITLWTGPCGDDRLRALRLGAAELERVLPTALIAAHLGGHPDAAKPSVRPDRVWTHFLAIGMGRDPVEMSRGCPSEPAQTSPHVLELARSARVVPLDAVAAPEPLSGQRRISVTRRPIERHQTDRTSYRPVDEQRVLERREAPLVEAFGEHLRALGHDVDGLDLEVEGASRPYRADLVDFTRGLLVEAKFAATIDDVREAVGQLAHYRYLVEASEESVSIRHEVVLLGSEPPEEVKAFLEWLVTGLVWRTDDGFLDRPRGAFVSVDG